MSQVKRTFHRTDKCMYTSLGEIKVLSKEYQNL